MYRRKLSTSLIKKALVLLLASMMLFSIVVPSVCAEEKADAIDSVEQDSVTVEDRLRELESQKKSQEDLSDITDVMRQKSIVEQQMLVLYEEIGTLDEQIAECESLLIASQEEAVAEQDVLTMIEKRNKVFVSSLGDGKGTSLFSLLRNSNSLTDFVDRASALSYAQMATQYKSEELQRAADNTSGLRSELESKQDQMRVLEVRLISNRIEMCELLLLAGTYKGGKTYKTKIQNEIDELNKELAVVLSGEGTPERLHSLIANYQAIDMTIKDGVLWLDPCEYISLSSPFGMRIHPVYKYWKMHNGVDLSNRCPTKIRATRSGVVIESGYNSSSGFHVTVDHLDGTISHYMHFCKASSLEVGDVVASGDVLGCMGTTGVSTGVHLHFGVTVNGDYVNPMKYIG